MKPLACSCAAARWDNPLSRSHGFRTFFQKRKSPYCHKRQHGLFSWADTPGWTGSPLQFQIKAAAFPGDFDGGHPALFCDGSGIHPVSPHRDLGQVQHTGRIGKTGVGIQGESSVDIKVLLVCVLKLHKHIGGWFPVPGQSQAHPALGFCISGIEIGLVDLQLKGRDSVLPGEGDPLGGIGLIELLEKNNDKFDYKVSWGCDLQTEHERYLTEQIFKKPIFVTDYPKEIKAFYMKANEDGKTVAAMDCLVPGIGEIIGGSQREDDYGKLKARMEELGLKEEDYDFYLDLRKYGSTRHSGFGLGFERCVMYLTGMGNIRDVIPFPRTVNNCDL